MLSPKQINIFDYTYDLPVDKIAQEPLGIRDSSKLLIYENHQIATTSFNNLPQILPTQSWLFFNQTKVVPARLIFKKKSGAKIEIFCLENWNTQINISSSLLQKKEAIWKCLIGGASKWNLEEILVLECEQGKLNAQLIEKGNQNFGVKFFWDNDHWDFNHVLAVFGAIPLPPYLNRTLNEQDKSNYQTVYANNEGSVAAPTAGLHFTQSLINALDTLKIEKDALTLHVGAGTFLPVKSAVLEDHLMHTEWIEFDILLLQKLIKNTDKKIIAVGTTSLRTLETIYHIGRKICSNLPIDFNAIAIHQWEVYNYTEVSKSQALTALYHYMQQHNLEKLITRTQILIAPSYQFKIVEGLITNFHQPQSTLLLLVAAFIGSDWRKVYEYALANQFRFLSYGDSSLLWENQDL